MERQNRRVFLKRCACFSAACGMISIRSGMAEQKDQWLSLGKLADIPDGKATRVEKALRIPGNKVVKKPKLIVVRKGESIGVMSAKCTHFGCEVNLLGDGSTVCPCHKSAFDRNGAVTHGPAKHPLSWYEVSITGDGEIRVNIGKTVEAPKVE